MSFVKKAYDIARKKVFFCDVKDYLPKVAEKMHLNNIGSILVREKDDVVGIITVNDMLRQISKKSDLPMMMAGQIMSSPVVMVDKDLEIEELVKAFNDNKVSRMVLIDKKEKVVGVVRDIAVYKYLTFYKMDEHVRDMFARDHLHRLY
ncbi:MAG: CBS domain-containing protein [Candidatus Woesearchaeota archaeon]|nr:CBS domain-containing protein [Candidatus Woesearchaeota archaeon]